MVEQLKCSGKKVSRNIEQLENTDAELDRRFAQVNPGGLGGGSR